MEEDEGENEIGFDVNASTAALEQEQEMSKDEQLLKNKSEVIKKPKNEKKRQSSSVMTSGTDTKEIVTNRQDSNSYQ